MAKSNAYIETCVRKKLVHTNTQSVKCGKPKLPGVKSSDKFGLTPKTSISPSLNRLWLLSSEREKKQRERERFEIESFVVLYPRAADSVTPWLSGAELLYYMKTLTHFFPPLVLPVISPPFSNRLYFLTCCICAPDIM